MKRFLAVLSALTAALAFVLALPAMASAGGFAGTTTVYSGGDYINSGTAQSWRYTASATGSVDRLNLRLNTGHTSTAIELGLYANTSSNVPGNLLASCTVNSPTANTWNSCRTSAVNVTSGTRYWLAVLAKNGTTKFRATNSGFTTFGRDGLTTLPSPFAKTWQWGQWTASFYADAGDPVPPPPAACADGTDNDGDGLVDLNDPGCSSSTDNDEYNAPPPPPAACADGADNDGDGLVDLADPGCASSTDDDEYNAPPPPPPSNCATPATLSTALASAPANSTVCLEAGAYGSFDGGARPNVTLTPAQGVARSAVTMYLDFHHTSGLTVDGVTITGAELKWDTTHDVTVRNSDVTGCMILRADEWNSADVLVEGNQFLDTARAECMYDGRLTVVNRTSNPSGVTIKGNLFKGGTADGILNGGHSTQIIGNEFTGIIQPASGAEAHSDSIQLLGSKETLIAGNYLHGNTVSIMAPDGGDHEVIRDNVFVGVAAYRPAIQLGAHVGTLFEHNTVLGIDIHMDTKGSPFPPSSDGVLRDNVLVNSTIDASSPECVNCTSTNNLSSGAVFVGGSSPQTYEGFKLADGSPGKNAATDGTDQGVRFP